jgi:hypothetical protein
VATAFKAKFPQLTTQPAWKNRLAALDDQIKMVDENMKKL